MLACEVDDLTQIYPRQDQPGSGGLTLHIAPGEMFGILGDNGAGKRTLVRQMAVDLGVLAPVGGGAPPRLAPALEDCLLTLPRPETV